MNPLEAQQNARFAALDPLLPPIAAPPAASEPLVVVTAGGLRAGGLLTHVVHAPGSWPALWGPLEISDLTAVPGDSGAAGLAALLGAWRDRRRGTRPEPDSGCSLAWPSRDAEASAVLLAHDFAPMTHLAVRKPEPPVEAGPARVTVRRAGEGDVEALTDLRLAEWRYTTLVGTARERPGARALLRAEVVRALRFSGLVWLAEDDGVPVGVAVCALTSPAPGDGIHGRLRPGRWGYVDTLSVAPEARGGGVGRALMAAAHGDLLRRDVRGTFLFYHPANPLSPVFWHRQGYRPLWTMWIRRPAWS
ncbi:Acetyltransferase (GNAT) family protein [Amycolatopsis pretoriensis]|uniref:Acetyltransferase (GNAT) family protein n=1 Tax=Amycolatopsis pretoriensis TaxID=218821 RepID=A0A1H5R0P1_9PSEU|nr:GNAT family N-acetyltransferase [Amycolatopsis pretoriensis]SEF31962.1 Acetyltransferase (GNAT) family protein [Amycolatopsis pretoriensis]